jgi:ADP-heptose:LPS heptosyltransferase
VIWAGDREHAWADKIAEASEQAAVVSPKTSLQELISVMRRARMYVGSDTGPMHAAAAVGTQCISLHGPTRPCDSGPYGTNHISLHKEYHVGSRRERRSADNHAMRQIQVEDVCNACEQVLAAQLEPVSSY